MPKKKKNNCDHTELRKWLEDVKVVDRPSSKKPGCIKTHVAQFQECYHCSRCGRFVGIGPVGSGSLRSQA